MATIGNVNSLNEIGMQQGISNTKGTASDRKTDFVAIMDSVGNSKTEEYSRQNGNTKQTGCKQDTAWKTDPMDGNAYTKTDTVSVSQNDALQSKDCMTEETMEETVKDIVKDVLTMEEESLTNIMEQLGMTWMDLLQPDCLQQFVMAVNDVQDSTALLLDESLLMQFQTLTEQLQGVQEQVLSKIEAVSDGSGMEEMFLDSQEMSNVLQDAMEDALVASEDGKGSLDVAGVEDVSTGTKATETAQQTSETTEMSESSQGTGTENTSYRVIVETEAASQGNSQQNDEKQADGFAMHWERAMQDGENSTFVQAGNTFSEVVENKMTQPVTEQAQVQTNRILEQIVQQIRVTNHLLDTTVEMQLNPESLGKVLLTVSMKEGMMTANFTVQTEEARMAVESQMYILRESLEQKELKVDAVEVMVSDFSFNQTDGENSDQKQMEQGDGKSRRFRFEAEGTEEQQVTSEKEAERVRQNVMRDTGSSIDFTA